jgi:hypothetical protein
MNKGEFINSFSERLEADKNCLNNEKIYYKDDILLPADFVRKRRYFIEGCKKNDFGEWVVVNFGTFNIKSAKFTDDRILLSNGTNIKYNNIISFYWSKDDIRLVHSKGNNYYQSVNKGLKITKEQFLNFELLFSELYSKFTLSKYAKKYFYDLANFNYKSDSFWIYENEVPILINNWEIPVHSLVGFAGRQMMNKKIYILIPEKSELSFWQSEIFSFRSLNDDNEGRGIV